METHFRDEILLVLTRKPWWAMMYLAPNTLFLGGQLTWARISISVPFLNVCMTVGRLIKLLSLSLFVWKVGMIIPTTQVFFVCVCDKCVIYSFQTGLGQRLENRCLSGLW